MDVIEGLLRIKRAREECREAEMHGARNRLEQAAELLRNAIAQQQQRDEERTERERTLYEDVCKRVVVVRDLNELNSEVDQMKDEARSDAEAVEEAQTQRTTRRKAFDDATLVWRAAALASQRFSDIARTEREEREKRIEWAAELELEEHPGRNVLAQSMQEDTEEA